MGRLEDQEEDEDSGNSQAKAPRIPRWLADPSPLLDQEAVHQGDLPRRPSEALEGDLDRLELFLLRAAPGSLEGRPGGEPQAGMKPHAADPDVEIGPGDAHLEDPFSRVEAPLGPGETLDQSGVEAGGGGRLSGGQLSPCSSRSAR